MKVLVIGSEDFSVQNLFADIGLKAEVRFISVLDAEKEAQSVIQDWQPQVVHCFDLMASLALSQFVPNILSIMKPLLYPHEFEEDRGELFEERVLLREACAKAQGLLSSPEVKQSIWDNLGKKITPLVISLKASDHMKIYTLALQGRLPLWTLSQSYGNGVATDNWSKYGLQRKSKMLAAMEYVSQSLTPGKTLVLGTTEEEYEVFTKAGHTVTVHSAPSSECLFVPQDSFDHGVFLGGPEFIPNFNATFAELQRVSKQTITLGFTRGKPEEGQFWVLPEKTTLDEFVKSLGEWSGVDRTSFILDEKTAEAKSMETLTFKKKSTGALHG